MNAEDLFRYLKFMKDMGKDLNKVEIALGDDEELNGVHYCSFIHLYNTKNVKNYTWQDLSSGKISLDNFAENETKKDLKELHKNADEVILIS